MGTGHAPGWSQVANGGIMTTHRTIGAYLVLAAALGLPQAALAEDSAKDGAATAASARSSAKFRLSTGISFSRGDYGQKSDTDVYSVPFSVKYSDGPLRLRVSIPWVRVDGPGSLLQTPEGRDGGSGGAIGGSSSSSGSEVELDDDGIDGTDDDLDVDDDGIDDGESGGGTDAGGGTGGAATIADRRRSGFGDVTIAATYSLALGQNFYFEPTAKVKLPTAERSKRLGTGKVDATLAADLVKTVGKASLYLHGRRKFAGRPDGSTIRSTWGAGGGASVRLARGIAMGADYDWQQSAYRGRKASSEITGWTNFRLNRAIGLTIYAGTGLNANSADFMSGCSISYRF